MVIDNMKLCFLQLFLFSKLFGDAEPILMSTYQGKIGEGDLSIGRFTNGYSNLRVWWALGEQLTIGSFCSLGGAVTIYMGGNHRTDWITTFPFGHIYTDYLGGVGIQGHPESKGAVTIGNDVWVGDYATIMSGVTIGDGAVIAGNSVVTKDVEPYTMVGGNPAKFIRYRFDEEIRALLQKLRWWDLDIEQIKELIPELCCQPDAQKIKTWIEKYRKEEL